MTCATGTRLVRLVSVAALAVLGVAAPSAGQSPSFVPRASEGGLSVTPSALAAGQPQQPTPVRGSVPGPLVPGTLKLTLKETLERALQHNLAVILGRQGVDAANGGRLQGLSGVAHRPRRRLRAARST